MRPSAPFSTALCANFWLMTSWKTMPPQLCAAWFKSSRAPSEVISIGTLYFSQTARSASRRLLDLCTIWFTANGADRRLGFALSQAASSSLIRAIHSSSSEAGRAFSAGNEPTTPALHWAITRSGTEMMNSGEPITGIDRRPLNKAGMDICGGSPQANSDWRHVDGLGCQTSYQARNRASCACGLLTERRRDEMIGPAVVRLARPAGNVGFCRTALDGVGAEAAALLKTLALAEPVGAGLAVRRAIARRTDHPARDHRGRFCETRHRIAGIPDGIFGP